MTFQQKEVALLRAMASAKSLKEQAALAEELQTIRAEHQASLRDERDLDWADMVVDATLTPVWRGSQHTAASDWLDEVSPVDSDNSHQTMMAEASVWFNRTSPEVRADSEEFTIQAEGMAHRLAGRYGEGASAAQQAFVDYVTFLWSREAASGLDQIQQTIDPNNQPKTTELPTDVFDTFAPPVAPENEGVDEAQSSHNAQTVNEMIGGAGGADLSGGGEGTAGGTVSPGGGRPSEHNESGTQVGHYGPGPVTSSLEDEEDPFGSLFSRSLALNYTGSLTEWTERLAKEAKQCKGAGCTNEPTEKGLCASCKSKAEKGSKEVAKDFEKKSAVQVEHLADVIVTEAASTLDQITQTTAPDGVTEKPTPLPGDVMFPLSQEFEGEENTGAEGGEVPSRHVETPAPQRVHSDKKKKTKKEVEDERGAYNPFAKDSDDGDDDSDDDDENSKEASLIAEAAMQFMADYFGASDEPHKVPGHEQEGYDEATHNSPKKADQHHNHAQDPSKNQVGEKSVHRHDARPAQHTTTNPEKKQNLSVGGSQDYTKAYNYASRWAPGTPLVQTGSKDFEIGLYDGIKTNSAENRKFWVIAHKRQSIQYGYLADRLVSHARHTATLRRTAGTTTDLDTAAPATYPQPGGNTPLSGPGQKPPLDGQQDVTAPAGAAPYNGSEPKGHSVVPGVSQTPPKRGPSDTRPAQSNMYDGPLNRHRDNTNANGSSLSGQTMAFRQRVQATLLAETEIEE